ncbi:aminomethyl-transferring glycine dehydrogenase subunit GcvPA [Candidatus Sumerlaeota bacterium]|nr:aminomethyl-transferring glycine dehydrogenase subunit GcvPA [Candidatus Sumerlaeota bacterium]
MPDCSYIPNREEDRQAMLKAIGAASIEEFFASIPESARAPEALDIPPGMTELELSTFINELAGQNKSAAQHPCFLGAGIYDHYIPAVVDFLAGRSEFYTAYTPYQAEASQGTLQAIFEYQTMIARLTELDVSNASLYDGATALAEAATMAIAITRRKKVVIAGTLNPESKAVLASYLDNFGHELEEVATRDGVVELDVLKEAVDDATAAVIIQQPNFYGCLEDVHAIAEIAHAGGALYVAAVDPISLGLLQSPGAYGADIAVGEGQALGNPMCAGGATFGFMALREKLMRKMPGRLVGETIDADGKRGYCLTLQAREQHIRRDKASSNICSNQGLLALRGAIYLAAAGPQGLRNVAEACAFKAHDAAARIREIPGFSLAFDQPFFKEFAIDCPAPAAEIARALFEIAGILGGYDMARVEPEHANRMLIAVTEKRTPPEIDALIEALSEISVESSQRA